MMNSNINEVSYKEENGNENNSISIAFKECEGFDKVLSRRGSVNEADNDEEHKTIMTNF